MSNSDYEDSSTDELFEKISDLANEASGRDDDDIDWELTEMAIIMGILQSRNSEALEASGD